MINIIRAFTLFHDKIMISNNSLDHVRELEKKYHVIGYFDWFQTDVVTSEKQVQSNLMGLFNYNLKLNDSNSEFQSFQNIFGFRENSDKKDDKFWTESLVEPIYFVSFIQLEEYKKCCYDTIENILANEYTQAGLNTDNFIVYYTLDKNDFIICFKSNSYKTIMDIINSLYTRLIKQGINIIYSYTNLIIRNSKEALFYSAIGDLSETIDSICIKTILNNYSDNSITIPQKIDLYCQKLSNTFYPGKSEKEIIEKNIVGYEILGDTDCRFIARYVPLNILLKSFLQGGILSKDDNDFNYCFLSSMTSLNINYGSFLKDYRKVERKIREPNNRTKKSELDIKINAINKELRKEHQPIVTLLHQISNYIVFSGYQIEQYEYSIMMEPISVLLDIILNNSNSLLNNNNSDIVDNLYEYLNNIYSILQENTRTDIRFYGISDYSMMSYYSPTKLRAFYSIIVNKMSKHYASMSKYDKDLKYAFLIFFTYAQETYVDQLWKNRFGESKLMMVKISEKDFYCISDLTFQLAHEVAHFVGNEEIRKRIDRFYLIIEFIFYRVYLIIEKNRQSVNDNKALNDIDNDKTFHAFYNKMLKSIKFSVRKLIEYLIIEDSIEREYDLYYLDNIENYISKLLFEWKVLDSFFEEYYEFIINKYRERLLFSEMSFDESQSTIRKLYEFKKQITHYTNRYKVEHFIGRGSDFDYIKHLMYESYADMSAILMFDLSVTEFLGFIVKRIDVNLDYSNPDDLRMLVDGNLLFQRCSIIIKAFSEVKNVKLTDNAKTFSDYINSIIDGKKDTGKQEIDKIKSIIIKVLSIIDSRFDHPARYACNYIKNCIQAYYNNDDISNVQKEMRTIFNKINDKETINIIKYINEYVAEKNCIDSHNT